MTAGWARSSTFRPKKKFVLALLLVFVLFFFLYQMLFISLLDDSQSKILEAKRESPQVKVDLAGVFDRRGMVRGIRLSDLAKYKPDAEGMFACLASSLKIPFEWLNDDYCDCPEDGSDEPGTSACTQGHFYCSSHARILPGKIIPSSRVNDGVCDCCDGADEWTHPGTYRAPCFNACTRS